MARKFTWEQVERVIRKSPAGIGQAVVNELHQMFLLMESENDEWSGGVVSEMMVYECKVPPLDENSFTVREIADYAVDNLSLEAGLAIQNVLYGLLGGGITPAERRKVASISTQIIQRDKGTGKNFDGAHIGKVVYNYGTYNENNYGEKKQEEGLDPFENLFLQMIEPLRNSRDWKGILMPYCAGMIEGVLPKWPHALFIRKTGIEVPRTPYSNWTRKDQFSQEELEPYAEQFVMLKRQIDQSK